MSLESICDISAFGQSRAEAGWCDTPDLKLKRGGRRAGEKGRRPHSQMP
jgi:hypothetical protein